MYNYTRDRQHLRITYARHKKDAPRLRPQHRRVRLRLRLAAAGARERDDALRSTFKFFLSVLGLLLRLLVLLVPVRSFLVRARAPLLVPPLAGPLLQPPPPIRRLPERILPYNQHAPHAHPTQHTHHNPHLPQTLCKRVLRLLPHPRLKLGDLRYDGVRELRVFVGREEREHGRGEAREQRVLQDRAGHGDAPRLRERAHERDERDRGRVVLERERRHHRELPTAQTNWRQRRAVRRGRGGGVRRCSRAGPCRGPG